MVTYILDGSKMLSRETAHDELARALHLPEYYGRNLDALWDCVSTMQAHVALVSSAAMLEALGLYGKKILSVLEEAAQKNPSFSFSQE